MAREIEEKIYKCEWLELNNKNKYCEQIIKKEHIYCFYHYDFNCKKILKHNKELKSFDITIGEGNELFLVKHLKCDKCDTYDIERIELNIYKLINYLENNLEICESFREL